MLGHVGIGAHEQQSPPRDVRHARPDLLTVDDPLVAVARRRRGERRDVGPGAGLAEHLAPDLFARERGPQEPLLLLLGAERDQRGPGHADAHHVAQQVLRRARLDQPLVDEILEARVDAESALPLGEVDPREPEVELRRPRTPRSGAPRWSARGAPCALRPPRRSPRRWSWWSSVALGGAMRRDVNVRLLARQPTSPPISESSTHHRGTHGRGSRLHERARPGRDDPARRRVARRTGRRLPRAHRAARPPARRVPDRRGRPGARRPRATPRSDSQAATSTTRRSSACRSRSRTSPTPPASAARTAPRRMPTAFPTSTTRWSRASGAPGS